MTTLPDASRRTREATEKMTAASAVVELTNVTVDFRSGRRRQTDPVRAVDDVTLVVDAGETVGLVGGTGSGKSTLAHVITGRVRPTAGTVKVIGSEPATLKGKGLRDHQRRVQIVPQDPYSSLDPRLRAVDIVAEPLTLGLRRPTGEQRSRVAEVLDLVGISRAKAEHYPFQFSGGQRQRLAIARALAPRPELIVLDEPTSALDVSIRAQILNLLKDLQRDHNITYLVISHDMASVAYLAERVAVMHLGRIVETATADSIYEAPAHPYAQLLLSSVPAEDGSFLDIGPARSASVPAPAESSCKYVSRCALHAQLTDATLCTSQRPLPRSIAAGHEVACHYAVLGRMEPTT